MTFEQFTEQFHIKLNEQQLSAVTAVDGPVLLLAVPGSGKTTVLVTRIAYMIHCLGIAPENILTLTYTRASARDMKERYLQLFGGAENVSVPEADDFGRDFPGTSNAYQIEFRTINSICVKIINYYAGQTGRTPYRIADEGTQAQIITRCYQTVQGEYPSENERSQTATMIAYIKNMMLSEQEIEALDKEGDILISKIYPLYIRTMNERNLMDFDDQLVTALKILRLFPAVLEHFQRQYRYICVDEAQDTSKIQHKIIALLAADNENLFMVGDEDQSIYGFRAAYPEALLHFEREHTGAKVLLMEKNYRSLPFIVTAADRFIKKNTLRHDKTMTAARGMCSIAAGGEDKSTAADETNNAVNASGGFAFSETAARARVDIIKTVSRRAQYKYLAKAAADCSTETAVLFRDNSSALPLIDQLERDHIPYRLTKPDTGFFGTRTVSDIIHILQFARDPSDTGLFMQIYYGIKLFLNKEEAQRCADYARQNNMQVMRAVRTMLQQYGRHSERHDTRIREVELALREIKEELPDIAISRILKDLGYASNLEGKGTFDEKIFILKTLATKTESIPEFLARLNHLKQVIEGNAADSAQDSDCPFILSTIHMSKGLEYDTVYLIDVMDGLFPQKTRRELKKDRLSGFTDLHSKNSAVPKRAGQLTLEYKSYVESEKPDPELAAYEEERRVFYVGITRAKNELHLFKLPNGSEFIEDLEEKKPGGAAQNSSGIGSGRGSSGIRNKESGVSRPGSLLKSGSGTSGALSSKKPSRHSILWHEDHNSDSDFLMHEYQEFLDGLSEGSCVTHKIYGAGYITEITPSYLVIDFDEHGVKRMNPKMLFQKKLLI